MQREISLELDNLMLETKSEQAVNEIYALQQYKTKLRFTGMICAIICPALSVFGKRRGKRRNGVYPADSGRH